MPTIAAPKPPPTDGEILNAFTDPNCTTKYLCEEFGLSLRKLEEWMDRPDIQESIQRLQRINESRARVVALEHVSWAVSTLANLAGAIHVGGQLPRPETARKAANTILHLSGLTKGPANPRGRKRNKANPPALPSPISAPSANSAVNPVPLSTRLASSTAAKAIQAKNGAAPPAPITTDTLPSPARPRACSSTDPVETDRPQDSQPLHELPAPGVESMSGLTPDCECESLPP